MTIHTGGTSTIIAILLAAGGWLKTIVTNWDKSPWAEKSVQPLSSQPTNRLRVYAIVKDANEKPLTEARITISEIRPDNSTKEILSRKIGSSTLTQELIEYGGENGVRVSISHKGYSDNEVMVYRNAITVPAVLTEARKR